MLLLLKGTSATLTASIIGIGSVVASGSTATASIIGTGVVVAPNSFEFRVTSDCIGTGIVVAISQGLLGRTAFVSGGGFVNAFGGFGGTSTIVGAGVVTATVGSFFDGGNVNITGTGVLSVTAQFSSTSSIVGIGITNATASITGGTVSTASSIVGIGSVIASLPLYVESASLIGQGIVTATGGLFIPFVNQARTMRLSFSADEIRTFFRKG